MSALAASVSRRIFLQTSLSASGALMLAPRLAAGQDAPPRVPENPLGILIRIVAPMTPHLSEECWREIGGEGLVAHTAWPAYDDRLVAENEVTLPVQINGKKRADLTIARDADQSAVEEAVLALEAVQAALGGQKPKKIIVVPQRIVNVVV